MHQPPLTPDPLNGHPVFEFKKKLAQGTFGFVCLYLNKETREDVAIKFLERHCVSKYVESEVLNHRKLSFKSTLTEVSHPHVIEFKRVFLSEHYICICMEYANGGNMSSYIKNMGGRLKETTARWFFQQLIIGLDYCHQKGVVNRDIKLENTLLQVLANARHPPLVKICDFGYSKAQDVSAPKSRVGTLAYMAPEVIKGTGGYNGSMSDVWSCAVMLYTMLFGLNPFQSQLSAEAEEALATLVAKSDRKLSTEEVRIVRILNALWCFPDDAAAIASPACQDLLQRTLVADPARRLSIVDIQQHPWFATNLPERAMTMNQMYIAKVDDSNLQSERDVHAIIQAALASRSQQEYETAASDGGVEGGSGMDDMISAEISAMMNQDQGAPAAPVARAGT